MQAQIAQEGEVTVVRLVGRVDVETAEPFRHACMKYLLNKKVVFNFSNLSFVGSSGILPFLEAFQTFASTSVEGFTFCGMGVEFRKVFAASPLGGVTILEDETQAIQALLRGDLRGGTPQAIAAVPMAEDGNFGVLSLRYESEDSGATSADLETESDEAAE